MMPSQILENGAAAQILRKADDPGFDLQDVQLELHEYLQQNKDKDLVCQLLSVYLQSRSKRVFGLLMCLRDPFHKWLLERCAEQIRSGETLQRVDTLKLLLGVVQRDPSWLHEMHPRIVRETVHVIKESRDNGAEAVPCFIATVILASLLPLVPGAFDKRSLESMFQAFSFAAETCLRRKHTIPDLTRQHLCSALFTLYKVLYSMFPCNFLAFLRVTYGNSDRVQNKATWEEIIWPMMKRTYFHPFLVQYNVDSETHKDRWKGRQKHDIIADCQSFFCEQVPLVRQHQQQQHLQQHNSAVPSPNIGDNQQAFASAYQNLSKYRVASSKPCSIPTRAKDFARRQPSSDGVLGKTTNLLEAETTGGQAQSDVSSSFGSIEAAEEAKPEEPAAFTGQPVTPILPMALSTPQQSPPANRKHDSFSGGSAFGTPQRPRRHRKSSSSLPPIPAELTDDDSVGGNSAATSSIVNELQAHGPCSSEAVGANEEDVIVTERFFDQEVTTMISGDNEDLEETSKSVSDVGFCSTTQRLTQEPTNSISEHAEVQDDPPAHSEMESLLGRQRYRSQCQPSPPGSGCVTGITASADLNAASSNARLLVPRGGGAGGACVVAHATNRRLTRSMSCPSPGHMSSTALSGGGVTCLAGAVCGQDESVSLSETTASSSSNEDLSSRCLSLSLWPSSPEPRRNKDGAPNSDVLDEKTPAELLEEHMKACAGQVLREMELQQIQAAASPGPIGCGITQGLAGAASPALGSPGNQQVTSLSSAAGLVSPSSNAPAISVAELQKELSLARAHATMLYIEMLYDRHRKEIHIERNRRLLEKAKRIIQLEEQNTAMAGQVREAHEELRLKTLRISELQRCLDEKDHEAENHVADLLRKTQAHAEDVERLTLQHSQISLCHSEQKSQLDEANQRLNALAAELHEAKLELKTAREKAEKLTVYQERSSKLEQELIILQEMYRRLEEMARRGVSDPGHILSKDELTKELKQCHARLQQRKAETEAVTERLRVTNARATFAEKSLAEVRNLLSRVESTTAEQVRAKDERIAALRRSRERLSAYILQLQAKADEAEALDKDSCRSHVKHEHDFSSAEICIDEKDIRNGKSERHNSHDETTNL